MKRVVEKGHGKGSWKNSQVNEPEKRFLRNHIQLGCKETFWEITCTWAGKISGKSHIDELERFLGNIRKRARKYISAKHLEMAENTKKS